jgi:hypothetical protein
MVKQVNSDKSENTTSLFKQLLDWDDRKMKTFAKYVKSLTPRHTLEMIAILQYHISISECIMKDFDESTTEEDKNKYRSLMEDLMRLTKLKLTKYNFPTDCYPDD